MVKVSYTNPDCAGRTASCGRDYLSSPEAKMDKSVEQEIRELLTAEAQNPDGKWHCPDCGSAMPSRMATITLGNNKSWTLPLRACANCNSGCGKAILLYKVLKILTSKACSTTIAAA
jgi:hypothetical protein